MRSKKRTGIVAKKKCFAVQKAHYLGWYTDSLLTYNCAAHGDSRVYNMKSQ